MKSPRHISSGRCRSAAARRRRAAFTLIELLTVISIIAVLAGLVVGLAPVAGVRMREAKLKAELSSLVAAIETYKAKYGVYPPDNYDPVRNVVNPALSPLYYELTGVIVVNNGDKGFFEVIDDNKQFQSATAQQFFNRDGFVNSATRDRYRRLIRHTFKESQSAEIFRSAKDAGYKDVEVLAVGFAGDASGKKNSGFAWPLNIPAAEHPIPTNPGLNPWRYVSTNPTNNPGTFDLWAEVIIRGQKKIYGNWKQ